MYRARYQPYHIASQDRHLRIGNTMSSERGPCDLILPCGRMRSHAATLDPSAAAAGQALVNVEAIIVVMVALSALEVLNFILRRVIHPPSPDVTHHVQVALTVRRSCIVSR